MLLHDKLILGVGGAPAHIDQGNEIFKAVTDLQHGINGVASHIKDIVTAALQIVGPAGQRENLDAGHVPDEGIPIARRLPAALIAVGGVRDHIAQIVQQHPGKGFAHVHGNFAELLRPAVPELKLHADPMLPICTAALRRLVINADAGLALGAADHDADAVGAADGLPVAHSGDEMLVLGVLGDLVDVQNAGVVVIGHVQAGHMQGILMDKVQQLVPLAGQSSQVLEIPAALAGHLAPYAHVFPAIVVDGDTAEIEPVHIAPGALGLRPGTLLQAQGLNKLLRRVLLAGERQPIV